MGSVSILHVVKSTEIINQYEKIGVDVKSYFSGIDEVELRLNNRTNLMQWTPSVVGDGNFYAELSKNIGNYYPLIKDEYTKALLAAAPGHGTFDKESA